MNTTAIKPVYVRQVYKFCPEIIFDAWVRSELVSQWLFTGPTSEIINAEIVALPGGRFSILELDRKNGVQVEHAGKYLSVERPHKLSFSLQQPGHFTEESIVTVEIVSQPGGCRLMVTETGMTANSKENNWGEMLQKLDAVLKEMAKKTF